MRKLSKILVLHRSVQTKTGVKLLKTKGVMRSVKAHLEVGLVKDHCNEVWAVKVQDDHYVTVQ